MKNEAMGQVCLCEWMHEQNEVIFYVHVCDKTRTCSYCM